MMLLLDSYHVINAGISWCQTLFIKNIHVYIKVWNQWCDNQRSKCRIILVGRLKAIK